MRREIDWTNTLFVVTSHVLAVAAIVWAAAVQWSWWTFGLGLLWFALCGVSITGGYHRLFSHRAYKARWPLRLFYLFFGAAAVQNSALKWSTDHRLHHAKTDEDEDPYSVRRGFWWAHIGWVFHKDPQIDRTTNVRDLEDDPLVRLQDRYYVPIAFLSAAVLPGLLGLLWGDPIGAILFAGFLRLVIQWHATFAVNSVAHSIGSQPFSTNSSARDSFLTAFITLGEGYHNFHHRFQVDYRNGIRWFHLDPTKWFVWGLSKIGMTSDLRRTPAEMIRRARLSVLGAQRAASGGDASIEGGT